MREIIDKKPAAVFFTGGLLIQTANVIIHLNMTRMLQIYIDQDTSTYNRTNTEIYLWLFQVFWSISWVHSKNYRIFHINFRLCCNNYLLYFLLNSWLPLRFSLTFIQNYHLLRILLTYPFLLMNSHFFFSFTFFRVNK